MFYISLAIIFILNTLIHMSAYPHPQRKIPFHLKLYLKEKELFYFQLALLGSSLIFSLYDKGGFGLLTWVFMLCLTSFLTSLLWGIFGRYFSR